MLPLFPSPTNPIGGITIENLHIGDVVQLEGKSLYSVFLVCGGTRVWQFPLELFDQKSPADLLAVRHYFAMEDSNDYDDDISVETEWQNSVFNCTNLRRSSRVTRILGNVFDLSTEKGLLDDDPIPRRSIPLAVENGTE